MGVIECDYETSTGKVRPGTSKIGAPPKNSENRLASIVAEVTINRRSSRLECGDSGFTIQDFGICRKVLVIAKNANSDFQKREDQSKEVEAQNLNPELEKHKHKHKHKRGNLKRSLRKSPNKRSVFSDLSCASSMMMAE